MGIARKPDVRIRLFGPPELAVDGAPVELGGSRVRHLFAGLVAAVGDRVPRDALMEWIPDSVAANDREAFWEVVALLRKKILAAGMGDVLVSKEGWVRLGVDPACVDVHRFRTLADRARNLTGDDRSRVLAEAVLLRQGGQPLAGLTGPRVEGYRRRLLDECREVELEFHRGELAAGRHAGQLPGLVRLLDEYPTNSRIAALTMYACYRSDALPEALDVFRVHRNNLTESGLVVDPKLADIHARMVAGKSDLGPGLSHYLGAEPREEPAPAAAGTTGTADDETTPEPDRTSASHSLSQHADTIVNGAFHGRGHMIFGRVGTVNYPAGPEES